MGPAGRLPAIRAGTSAASRFCTSSISCRITRRPRRILRPRPWTSCAGLFRRSMRRCASTAFFRDEREAAMTSASQIMEASAKGVSQVTCLARPLELDDGVYLGIKRLLDVVAAVLLLVATAPLLIMAMALIKLTSRGPA